MYVEITNADFIIPNTDYGDDYDLMTIPYASCEETPQVLSTINPVRGCSREFLIKNIKREDSMCFTTGRSYRIKGAPETYLVDISDDGESMRLVCPPGILDDDVNLSSEAIYAYNETDSSVVEVRESDNDSGWYFERYGLQDDGTFESIDSGLYDFERDDEGNIVEGYKSALEAYFEVAKEDGDVFCGPSMFELTFNAYCRASDTKVHAMLEEKGVFKKD